jgi:hypothetical protein
MIEAGMVEDVIRKKAPPVIADVAMHDRIFVDMRREAREAVRAFVKGQPDMLTLHVYVKRDVYFAVLDEDHRVGLIAGRAEAPQRVQLTGSFGAYALKTA